MDAIVVFPAHLAGGITPPPLRFLIDTGADSTIVSSADAVKLGIKYELSAEGRSVPFFGGQPLSEGPPMGGVGGRMRSYQIENVNLFLVTILDNTIELHEEHLNVIHIPEGGVAEIPNLLGRDIISRFDMSWHSLESNIHLTRVDRPGHWRVSVIPMP